ncbi:hypothetical protein E2320_005784, partial [Naja naja]
VAKQLKEQQMIHPDSSCLRRLVYRGALSPG